jgi:hypothetical protein
MVCICSSTVDRQEDTFGDGTLFLRVLQLLSKATCIRKAQIETMFPITPRLKESIRTGLE